MPKKEVKKSKDKTSFFKSFKAELKKVVWPTPKQLVNNTVAVLAIVVVTALMVFVLDLCFESINKYGLDKVKTMVVEKKDNNEETLDAGDDVEIIEDTNTEELTSEETTTETVEE